MLANDEISKMKTSILGLKNQINSKVLDTVFEQITGSKTANSEELRALKEINSQIINIKTELINKNQQLKINIEIYEWEIIENYFKFTAFPDPHHRLIKGLAELGLNNVKKYYDHIKNKTEFTIEYGDKTFYSSIENAKKIFEEDNKNNIDDYQFYVNLKPMTMLHYIEEQLNKRLHWLLNQTGLLQTVSVQIEALNNRLNNNHLNNDLNVQHPTLQKKLNPNQPYQTVVVITDKNGYSEYVPIKFQVKDINLLIEKIKQVDFNQLIPHKNQVNGLNFKVERHIHETFKETEKMWISVAVLNEQPTSKLEDKEYTLNVKIQEVDFQIKSKINLFNTFNDDVAKIEQNLVLPSNFYAGINNESEMTIKINENLKLFYDKNKFSVYVESEVFADNNSEYNEYRTNFFSDISKLAEFDSRKILAPVKYIIKIKVNYKEAYWLSKEIEKTILITEKI